MFLDIDVATPCGIFKGVEKNELAACAVSIIRAGDSMLQVKGLGIRLALLHKFLGSSRRNSRYSSGENINSKR